MSREEYKRKKLTKQERREVYEKCNHRCAYCGTEIAISNMQVDHLIPMIFYEFYKHYGIDIDCMDNYFPACRSCNNYKHSLNLEKFREAIGRWHEVLSRDNVTYRNAVRFRQVEPKPHRVMFYFEELGINPMDDLIYPTSQKEEETT